MFRNYCIAGKFGKFGKSSWFAKLKPYKVVVTIDNPLADLFICQTFSRQMLEKSKFAKHSPRQTFLLYQYCMLYKWTRGYIKTQLKLSYSTEFWRGKTLANQLFQSFGEENVGEFTIANMDFSRK